MCCPFLQLKISKLLLTTLIQLLVIQISYAENRYSYNARIQCGNSSTTNSEYFSASNDMEAENEARRIINNNTGYRGRGCEIIEMLSR